MGCYFRYLLRVYLWVLFKLPITDHIEPSTLFHAMSYATINTKQILGSLALEAPEIMLIKFFNVKLKLLDFTYMELFMCTYYLF